MFCAGGVALCAQAPLLEMIVATVAAKIGVIRICCSDPVGECGGKIAGGGASSGKFVVAAIFRAASPALDLPKLSPASERRPFRLRQEHCHAVCRVSPN
ncbi:hypothetical protein OCAR_5790 [Afipia carboxidovorans OM5]|nr:hypothetical protein OCAR_5790 [Afipia carboxidovorans OM5]